MKLLFAMTEGFLSAEATPVHPTALLTPFVVTSFKADASTNCHSPFFVFYSVERVGHQSPNHVRHFFHALCPHRHWCTSLETTCTKMTRGPTPRSGRDGQWHRSTQGNVDAGEAREKRPTWLGLKRNGGKPRILWIGFCRRLVG